MLYLLHGDPGTYRDWAGAGGKELIDARVSTGAGPSVVVHPDGNGPRWTEWADGPRWRIGTFIAEELVSYIDSHYRTSPHRDRRYIAGLSAGGFGAASLAMTHPKTFGGFASFSGYFDFGTQGRAHAVPAAASPDRLAESLGPNDLHVFIASGNADGIYTTETRRFNARLRAQGWDVQCREEAGGHGWGLWKSLLWQSLPILQGWSSGHRVSHRLHQAAASPAGGGPRP